MKQTADQRPKAIQPVSPGKWHINYDIEAFTDEETGREGWYFDYVVVQSLKKDIIVNALVRKQYSESEEFAILRKRQAGMDVGEFETYNDYVESMKIITNQILNQ